MGNSELLASSWKLCTIFYLTVQIKSLYCQWKNTLKGTVGWRPNNPYLWTPHVEMHIQRRLRYEDASSGIKGSGIFKHRIGRFTWVSLGEFDKSMSLDFQRMYSGPSFVDK